MSVSRRLAASAPAGGLLAWVGLLLLGFVGPAAAQFGDSHASSELFSRVEGGEVQVAIAITVDGDWHLYHEELGHPEAAGIPTAVAFDGEGIRWSALRFPEPHREDQVGTDAWAWIHSGTFVLYVRGELADGVAGSPITATISGLTCSDVTGFCVQYSEELVSSGPGAEAVFADFPTDLQVGTQEDSGSAPSPGAGSRLDPEPASAALPDDFDYESVEFPAFQAKGEKPSRPFLGWILLAFLAGLILNVMPCVLPVISIKILSFVQQAGEDRGRILQLGLAFSAGIVVVFLALAVLAVNLELGWGEQFQSQTFLVVMLGIVFAFSLSMFGVFELGVPSGVGALAGGPPREGLGDAFFKGMLATVLATPCSGPFLGSTLTWTLSQPPTTVFTVFLSLGLGMAFPYVVLTANPKLLKLVPKPGPWMDTFKHSMGFVLLLTVVYLMISLRQDMMLFTVAFLMFVALGCWWWGRFSVRARSKGRRLVTLGVSLALIAGGGRLSFVEFRDLFLPSAEDHGWQDFDPRVFQDALDSGQSVFVDFTADWCPNCKANEKLVYESEPVAKLLDEKCVLMLKADITHDSPRTDMLERLMADLGSRAIPFMAVFPGDAPLGPHVREAIVTRSDMLSILDTLPDCPEN
jgi:thiol:disulfide interchange protein